MEKNTTKYFLAIAVFSVWGLLLYRIYNKMNPSNDWQPLQQELVISDHNNNIDSFKLLLDYDSPFKTVKGSIRPRIAINNNSPSLPQKTTNRSKQRKVKKKQKPIPFPQVVYQGNISSKNGRTIALVKINNQIMNLAKGDSYEKVLLQKIYSDSIEVNFAGRDSIIMKGD